MSIGAKIKHLRESLGMTQVDLAQVLGFESATAISFIESGRNDLGIKNVMPICIHFGISPNELFGVESEKNLNIVKIKKIVKELNNAIK